MESKQMRWNRKYVWNRGEIALNRAEIKSNNGGQDEVRECVAR